MELGVPSQLVRLPRPSWLERFRWLGRRPSHVGPQLDRQVCFAQRRRRGGFCRQWNRGCLSQLVGLPKEYLAWRQNLEDDKGHTLDRPTVFRWTGPGKEQPWEGHHTHNIIVDLPMIEHTDSKNKFYVDGTWTHDPAEVSRVYATVLENVSMMLKNLSSSPPGPCLPILPPHLLQVILNKHTGISDKLFAFPHQCDPALLPEPNHVMLNHLYSLSIKDGVMVLSATYRYKKKYVTTLMYKPVWARVLWLYKPVWPVACGCISLSDQWPVAV
uniref:Protein kinase, AMP-activated, beta 1 non-catalytic subunit, a n=1 Tax=Oncorhynchus mykiss TaxID=8022 RepID=A0A8K9Y0R9_ONCMY